MAETMAADLSQIFPWMNQMEKVVDEAPTDLSLQKDHSVDRTIEEEERLDVESTDDKTEEADEPETAPSTGSAQSNGSSSRRKNCAPQRNEQGLTKQEINDELEHMIEEDTANEASGEMSALQNQLNSPSKLCEMLDAQKRLYASILEQQQKKEAERRPQLTQHTFGKLAATLKAEIIEQLSGSIDKIVSDFAASEMARLASQQTEAQPRPPIGLFHPMYMQSPMPNPFAVPQGPPTGIFPPAFNPFSQLAALSAARRAEDGEPRRKRSKLCSEIKSKLGTPLGRESPDGASDSPRLNTQASLSAYFPPTMVGHPLYGAGIFGERDESPVNSDEMSECGPYVEGQSSTLTPMHLRKAKLMFFYSRYPNSAMLKSYFPDIRFNKNNTAQLVKWFSNFREFYYIQMEKFARQALAEGIVNREDLHVSIESELFKQLNQHYNRNNHLQPPERLVFVVQETLREFFDAIKLGKDMEPSWKKTIYKVIARLDDAIPDYFKDPSFLERLE